MISRLTRLAGIAAAFVLGAGTPMHARAQADALDACLPFTMPGPDAIFASPHKVYAHYFSRFPLSIDNKPFGQDYYATQYLDPHGEKDKWLAHGGYLRSRPAPVPVQDQAGFQTANMEREVRAALARGVSGFTFDILDLDDVKAGGLLDMMLAAARRVDPRFVVIAMPDMAALGHDPDRVGQIVTAIDGRQGLLRDGQDRLVIAPFMAEAVKPADWQALLTKLAADGHPVSFRPTFLSLPDKLAAAYGAIGDGLGTFGTALPSPGLAGATQTAHILGKPFMAGVAPQSYRPKDDLFWEGQNSRAYRVSWDAVIAAQADAVQLTTWNDFSESSQVEPYLGPGPLSEAAPGIGFYDLTGYYAAWFLTGARPSVTRDSLYYFHRRESVAASGAHKADGTPNGLDRIELAGFLTEPGILSITTGGKTYRQGVGRGLQTILAPLAGGRPHFALIRHGREVIGFDSDVAIAGPAAPHSGSGDLTVWSGGATADARCAATGESLP